MSLKHAVFVTLSATLIAGASTVALAADSVVVAKADLKWKELGVPGLAAAPVSGDMTKGASRFFLKYPVGFVSPKHHHTSDHYVTMVSGTITLTVDGKDHRLGGARRTVHHPGAGGGALLASIAMDTRQWRPLGR